jgi:hypothetical protein
MWLGSLTQRPKAMQTHCSMGRAVGSWRGMQLGSPRLRMTCHCQALLTQGKNKMHYVPTAENANPGASRRPGPFHGHPMPCHANMGAHFSRPPLPKQSCLPDHVPKKCIPEGEPDGDAETTVEMRRPGANGCRDCTLWYVFSKNVSLGGSLFRRRVKLATWKRSRPPLGIKVRKRSWWDRTGNVFFSELTHDPTISDHAF